MTKVGAGGTAPQAATTSRTLLLVDDEEALLHALLRVFRHEHYTLLSATGGREALRLLAEHDIQVILSDHRMPEMTGIELLSQVRHLHPECVRMVLSGYADIEAITEAINRGHVYKFLHKPWDNEQLQATVRDAFERHDQVRRAAQFSNIYENTRDGIIITDRKAVIQDVNPAFTAITGHTPAEVIGLPVSVLAPDNAITGEHQEILAALVRDGRWSGELWSCRRDGESFPAWLNLSVLRDSHGAPLQYVGLFSDITERKSQEIALRESEKRFRDIMEFAPIGMVIVALDGRLLKVNQALCNILGYERNELEGMSFEQLTHPDDIADDLGHRRQLLQGELPLIQSEKRYLRKDGRPVWVQLTAAVLRDTHGVPQCFDAQVEDITERRQDQERIRQLAYYDTLTGLPNRRLLLERLALALPQALRRERRAAVMFLDLDHFKQINDTHGHDIGDELLKAVAARLAACVRSGDTVARQGGDEFVILLEEIAHPGDASRVAEKISGSLSRPLNIGALELAITTSIGIAIHPEHGLDSQSLMKNADIALYAVKEAGRNGYRVYDPNGMAPPFVQDSQQ